VDSLTGTTAAKARLRAILQTMTGERSVEDVCHELGVGRAYFQELRAKALAGALAALSPNKPGRRPRTEEVPADELARLREEKAELEEELVAMLARAELAVAMPRLLQRELRKGGRRSSERI
jgi:transposase-like protein